MSPLCDDAGRSQDSLEEALVATHQEMELYHNQPLAMEKLQFKKESLQNQLINIRGELSQASSVSVPLNQHPQPFIKSNRLYRPDREFCLQA